MRLVRFRHRPEPTGRAPARRDQLSPTRLGGALVARLTPVPEPAPWPSNGHQGEGEVFTRQHRGHALSQGPPSDRQTDSCFRDQKKGTGPAPPTTLLRRSAPVYAHTRVRARRLTDRVGCTTAHLYVARPRGPAACAAYREGSCGAGWSRRLEGGRVGRATLCVVGGVCVPWFLARVVRLPLVCRSR